MLLSFLLALAVPQSDCTVSSRGFASPATNTTVLALADEGGGSLALGGQFDLPFHRVAHWDGRLWSSDHFGLAGTVNALTRFDAGGGLRTIAGGEFPEFVASWDGATWGELPGAPDGGVNALSVFDPGGGARLYAGGSFLTTGGAPVRYLAQFNGATWSAVGAAFNAPVRALAVHDDGNGPALYAGGDFTSVGGAPALRIARWNGSVWSAVGGGAGGAVLALASFQGDLYAGGSFAVAGGSPAARVARWDGVAWSPLGAGTDADVHALAVHDDGAGARLYAGGDFQTAGGIASRAVAAWDGASWSARAAGVAGVVRALSTWSSGGTSELIAGGNFRLHEGTFGLHVARWTGTEWRALAEGFVAQQGVIASSAVARFDDGSGPATYSGGGFADAGGRTVGRLARRIGDRWEPAVPVDAGPSEAVTILAPCDLGGGAELLLGGQFTSAGGVACAHVARWDGVSFAQLGDGLSSKPATLLVDGAGAGARVYASSDASRFEFASGAASAVAVWSGGAWEPVGALFPYVAALEIYDDGTTRSLYAGGDFDVLPLGTTSHIARWNGQDWVPVGAPMSSGGTGFTDLLVWDDGQGSALYAAGPASNIGGTAISKLARWNGTAWSAVADYANATNDGAWRIAVFDDGAGRGPRLHVASNSTVRVLDAGTWTTVATQWGFSEPRELVAFDAAEAGDRELWWLGNMQAVTCAGETVSTSGSFVLRACDETGLTYCHGDGSEGACPCGNASAVGERQGCAHSLGSGGALRGRGRASLTQDTLILDGSTMTNSSALYFQGLVRSAPIPFGDGIKCTGGPFVRLATKSNVAGASTYPVAGDVSVSVRGHVLAPGTRHYQVRYRNAAAFCTSETFNYTNAVAIEWGA